MKKVLLLLLALISWGMTMFAQETAKPMTDTEVVRRVAILDIEGKQYENVVVTMKSTTPDYFITDKYKVKVKVEDSNGKKIWSKTFKNAFLYVFSNGQVQIGKKNFDQMVIQKVSTNDAWIGLVREKEGIY